jgi:hypothetical protein
MEEKNLNTEETANSDLGAVMCSFSKKELDLIAQSLMHLHNSNGEYLTWKKDEFSQQEIPKEMKRIMKVYGKVHKLRV